MIDVNKQEEYGDTLLMLAASDGNIKIVSRLLKHPDIDVNLQNEFGRTALDYAEQNGRTEIIKLLEGCTINNQEDYSVTLLALISDDRVEVIGRIATPLNIKVNLQDEGDRKALIKLLEDFIKQNEKNK